MAASIHQQLDTLIQNFDRMWSGAGRSWMNLHSADSAEFVMAALAAIQRATGMRSVYSQQAQLAIDHKRDTSKSSSMNEVVPILGGILKSLRVDINNGYLDSFEQLIHANLFADFIGMANHLLDERYKDAAAVIAGGVLEEHLRKLCIKNNIDIEITDKSGNTRPKRGNTLNEDLGKHGVYNTLDQQSVTAWLAIRNASAHAEYDKYDEKQVGFMIQSLTHFITRFPA